jgi:PAS domain S-box-containing protein
MPKTLEFDYRAFFESAPGLYLVVDRDLRIVTATDSWCAAMRRTRDEIAGRDIFEVLSQNLESGEPGVENLRASLVRVLQTRRRDAMEIQRLDVREPDGGLQERHWAPMNVPILDEDRQVRWIVHRVRDVTEAVRDRETIQSQRRLAREQGDIIEALRAANRELADRDRQPGDTAKLARLGTIRLMTSAIAHDMSQPLLSAMSYLGAFRRKTADVQVALPLEYLEKAEEQLRRAGDVVRGLRGFIAGEEGPRRIEDMGAMIRHAVELCDDFLRQGGVEIAIDVETGLPKVMADRTQIEQALVNLVRNAVEAMRDRPARRLTISTRSEGRYVRVDVSDCGPGISGLAMDNIFKPFRTSKSGSLGVGLSICREIVLAHDGTICAGAASPAGFTVSFSLPASSK